ncbi:solute carrier family 2, facilitated glucose transporter member 12 [Monodelphis domestica]|uniref:Solute carrier family 2, facilitated glucose transporter member 12 n=1 Tax=Monodelphis domestica TaxID=13616 RepID=F7F0U7_MONDO|nr:solute carrier family 2, facilitated glucose transporter member 12 [Monodelphis domestica]XP_016284396.1 solute carrier family 2, facilitated glucose transporter member 12 [Monodelphis domestica]XP_056674803.1 solute carrier family 2, facilitated glucose transporter member 12 [Monodelphis domestica]XP_056674804.1 solute carrier family 2, facilitated glucose transporter member 12 [Monodelphis domestica]
MTMVPVQNAEEPGQQCQKMRAAESEGNNSPGCARPQLPAPRGCGMFTFLSSVTAAVSGLLVGYELGLISGALLQLSGLLALSCRQQEMVVSSLLIGALLASLTGGFLIDRYGRRTAIILSSCLLGLGSLVLILTLSYPVLIVGRIAIGVSISLSSIATCVYIAEIAPQHRRGLLVSLNELMIVIGILLAYISNYAFASVFHGWKYMFGLVIPLGVLQAIAMYFLPPSPRFLVMKGYDEAASKVLGRLRGISDTTEELTAIKSSLKDEHQYSFWDLFRSKDNMRTRILIGLTLVFFVQITGQPNILFYASTVLKSVGFQSNEAASLASTGVGVVKVISTVPATLFVDQVGSKTFLCLGSSVMAASLVTMGLVNLNIHINFTGICRSHSPVNHSLEDLAFYGQGDLPASNNSLKELFVEKSPNSKNPLMSIRSDTERQRELTWASVPSVETSRPSPTQSYQEMGPGDVPEFLKWLSLVSLLFYVAAFSIGLGPMPWLVLSEIFPVGIRGRAMALTSSMNWGINLLVSLTFLTVTELIGLPWVCFIYTIMSLAALVFVVLFIPETKGCSLEQISMELAKSNYVKHNIYLMSHQREKLVPTELQKTKHQEQFLECKKLCGKEQSRHLFQEH